LIIALPPVWSPCWWVLKHVANWFVADGLHLFQNLGHVAFELVVHQNQPGVSGVDGDIAARAHEDVQIVGDLLNRELVTRRRLWRLRPCQKQPAEREAHRRHPNATGPVHSFSV
jgi:hypothetical protein